jgi:hypothetical protein
MAQPAAAIRAQIQAQYPGAAVVGRGRTWLRHQIGPQSYALDTSIGPLHVAGTETEINSDWVADTGAWQWKMEQADFHVHARNVFNAGGLCEYRDPVSQQWVIFDPQSINWINQDTSRQQIAVKQAINAQVSGDVMTFPAAYGAGRHFRYQLQTARLQKLITIDTLASLPAPTVTGTVWFEAEFSISASAGVAFYLDGVVWAKQNGVRVTTANRVECRDAATGQTVLWVLDFPRAFDSAGNEVIGELEVRRDGGPSSLFLTVRIPKAWIDAAVFPIFIDPTIDPVIGDGANDVFHDSSTGAIAWVTTGTSLFHGDGNATHTTRRQVGLIFTLNIDPGVTIDLAYLEGVPTSNNPNFTIPIKLIADVSDFSSAWRTTSPWPTTGIIGSFGTQSTNQPTFAVTQAYTTGTYARMYSSTQDIKALVQEVIDASGWSNGAKFRLSCMGNGSTSYASASFQSYEGNTSLAHRLHLEYTTGGGVAAFPHHYYAQMRK